jgi:hypothetical protein
VVVEFGDVMMTPHPGMDKENAKKMVKYILHLKNKQFFNFNRKQSFLRLLFCV